MNLLKEQITIPPRSCVIISASTPTKDLEVAVEGDQNLLINCNICVAREIAEQQGGKTTVMLTNFNNEYKHGNKGTTVAYLDEIMEATDVFVLANSAEPHQRNQASHPASDLNPSLPKLKQEQLKLLILQYKDCFSSSSKIQQTPVAKHHIITEESARPLRQSSFRVLVR